MMEDAKVAAAAYRQILSNGYFLSLRGQCIPAKAVSTGWGHKDRTGVAIVTLPSCLMLTLSGITIEEFIKDRARFGMSYQLEMRRWLGTTESIPYQVLYGMHMENWLCPGTSFNARNYLKEERKEQVWLPDPNAKEGPRWLSPEQVLLRVDSLFFKDRAEASLKASTPVID